MNTGEKVLHTGEYSKPLEGLDYRLFPFVRGLCRNGLLAPIIHGVVGFGGAKSDKHSHRGALTHVAYGLYRVNDVPIMDPDASQYAEAVLRVGEDAFLTHTAVLAFWDLALVNPPTITVGTFQRVRATVPERIDIIKRNDITETDITTHNAIRMTTVAQALTDCIPIVMIDRLDAATRDAYREGLVLRRDRDRVLELIESRDLHAVTI